MKGGGAWQVVGGEQKGTSCRAFTNRRAHVQASRSLSSIKTNRGAIDIAKKGAGAESENEKADLHTRGQNVPRGGGNRKKT